MAVINGTSGDDSLTGTSGDDTINGLGGNDTLTGGTGADRFVYSSILDFGSGTETITDIEPGDLIDLSGLAVQLPGLKFIGSGEFTNGVFSPFPSGVPEIRWVSDATGVQLQIDEDLDGVADKFLDILGLFAFFGETTSGSLVFEMALVSTPTTGNDSWLFGSNGDDVIDALAGDDTVQGLFGDDTLIGNDGNDFLAGMAGDDNLSGGAGNDTLNGGEGNDFLAGGLGDDVFLAPSGQDTIDGGSGFDEIKYDIPFGEQFNYTIGASTIVHNGTGETVTFSNIDLVSVVISRFAVFNDTLDGSASTTSMLLFAGGGNDVIIGGANDDTIEGGPGDDTLTGGAGADLFDFDLTEDVSVNGDIITDFEIGDIIDFETINRLGELGVSTALDLIFIGANAFTGVVGEYRTQTGGGQTQIQIDEDGDGVTDRFVVITNGEFVLEETFNDSAILIVSAAAPMPTAGDDLLTGTSAGDLIDALGGNDTVFGLGGNDTLRGGAGSDSLIGSDGNDLLFGDGGNDTLDGGAGNDVLFGGAGDNTLIGGAGNDDFAFDADTGGVVDGGEGDFDTIELNAAASDVQFQAGIDPSASMSLTYGISNSTISFTGVERISFQGSFSVLILGTAGSDNLSGSSSIPLFGGGGNDTITGSIFSDTLDGGSGNDRLGGDAGNDSITGGKGFDTIRGASGNDTISGDGGNDKIFGGVGVDLIDGGAGADRIRSEGGNDTVEGGVGNDRIFGSFGFDLLNGGVDNDFLDGNGGNDTLNGGDGIDTLIGNFGFDSLNGGADDDRLQGSTGNDRLTGGTGDDTFVFALGDGRDRILDFTAGMGTDDVIELSGFVAAFDTFAEVLAASSQSGASVLIDFGGGDTIRLLNTSLGDLHQDDFLFV